MLHRVRGDFVAVRKHHLPAVASLACRIVPGPGPLGTVLVTPTAGLARVGHATHHVELEGIALEVRLAARGGESALVERCEATGAGALVGATLGALTEQELKRQPAMEYVVRDEAGQLYTIVQGVEPRLVPGQRVYLQESAHGRARLVPAG